MKTFLSKFQNYQQKDEMGGNRTMTQEDKNLLLKDLSTRLPYQVKVSVNGGKEPWTLKGMFEGEYTGMMLILEPSFPSKDVSPQTSNWQLSQCKPFLRPMSSMTEEEKFELKQEHVKDQQLFAEVIVVLNNTEMRGKVIPHFAADWCDKNMFDYRGLIPAGLALSTEENNPYKD